MHKSIFALVFLILNLPLISASNADVISVKDSLAKGKVSVHARYYFMASDNAPGLTDAHAHAFSLSLGYVSPQWKGFSFGMSGSSTFHLESSSLDRLDALTQQPNRYEIGLFDIEHPASWQPLPRLEELYIRFNSKKIDTKLGNQLIRTPFINPQDGRMRPTLVQGLTSEWSPYKKWKIQAGLLNSIAPRSTVNWYSIGNSIGKYPVGVSTTGVKSGYSGKIKSDFIGYIGINSQFGKGLSIQVFDQYVDRVFNTSLVQVNWDKKLNETKPLILQLAGQWITQKAIQSGGNDNPINSYFDKGATSQVFGFRLGFMKTNNWNLHVNYTRITGEGRYLMPREWGKDPMFTFMQRERNEGFGNVHAMNLVAGKELGKSGWKIESSIGHFLLPDVKNYALNKYGIPSYAQFNFDLRYQFKGSFQGLNAQLLFVYKGRIGETYGNKRYVLNKVDMSLYNFIVNYTF